MNFCFYLFPYEHHDFYFFCLLTEAYLQNAHVREAFPQSYAANQSESIFADVDNWKFTKLIGNGDCMIGNVHLSKIFFEEAAQTSDNSPGDRWGMSDIIL